MTRSDSQPITPKTARPIVVIAEPIARAPRAWLASHAQVIEASSTNEDPFFASLTNARGLVVRTYTKVDQALLSRAPNLRVVARAGVGLDNIDLCACEKQGVIVVHTPSANTNAVVEYVTQIMLASLRQIEAIDTPDTPISPADWHALRERAITPRSCVGATLGIIGHGKIGSALASVARALQMNVIIHDSDPAQTQSVLLKELAEESDVISVHVDGRASNHHCLSSSFFESLKPDVILINSSRGFVIDDLAAAAFARSNPNSKLIFDVHTPEPIAVDSPLNSIANIVRTPHIAAATKDAKEAMSWVVRDVVRVLNNQEPMHPARTQDSPASSA